MPGEDLTKLKIDRSIKTLRPARRRRLIYLSVAAMMAALTGILYLGGFLRLAIPVEVATISQVYPSQEFTQLNASGYVVAQRKAAVASKVTGRLVELRVEEGSRVREGQIIARFENEDVMAARDQADANLKVARANLEGAKAELEEAARVFNRNRELLERKIIPRAEYDATEASYERAKATVNAAEAAVGASRAAVQAAKVAVEYTLIRAPFDAVVLTKNADIGDIVTPIGAAANVQAAVVTIADLGSLQVEADVSETNLSMVKVGQPCEIQLDALPDSRFRGIVHAIVPTLDRSKATILVKVRFLDKDPRILPEMRAKVAFLSRPVKKEEMKPYTAINRSALVTHNGLPTAFVVQGDRVVERPIRTGASLSEMVEVLEGVKAGDKVVLRPPKRLKDGARIKIVAK
jgi:RND family efflux transporter MFP subunit